MVVTDYNEQFLDKRGTDHLIDELKAYIDGIATGNIDLSNYVTKEELQAKLDALDINIDLSSYATKEELTNAINSIDLSSYAKKTDIPTVPTKTSQLTNDSGFLTQHQDLSAYATTEYVDNAVANVPTTDLTDYAKTSDIPTKVSELENDSNYLSSIPEEYVTETELSAKGYLTEHQDISGKVDKVEGKSLIADTEIARLASVDNYDDTDIRTKLANKADITDIPTTVAELTDSADYVKTIDIPTSLPANGGNANTVNNHTVETDVPNDAVFTDTIYDDTEVKEQINKLNSNLDGLQYSDVAGGKNLFDKNSSENVDGWLINGIPNGENTYNQKTSHFIRIDGNTFVYNKGNVNNKIAFYDSNKTFISEKNQVTDVNVVTMPTNAKYVRVVYFDVEKDLVQIEKGTTATPYEPYIPSVKMLAEEVSVQNESLGYYGLNDKKGEILFGYWDSDGTIKTDKTKWVCTQKIPCTKVVRAISKTECVYIQIMYWKADGTYLGFTNDGNTKDATKVVKDGTDYVTVSFCYPNDVTSSDFSGYVYTNNAIDELKNDLDKLNSLPKGSIIQIDADKDNTGTTIKKYGWQYLGKSNIQYENGGVYILEVNVYRKNN